MPRQAAHPAPKRAQGTATGEVDAQDNAGADTKDDTQPGQAPAFTPDPATPSGRAPAKLAERKKAAVEGVDVFKIAGRSISGVFYSRKTGSDHIVRQAYTTQEELYLGLYLEYHPLVRVFQRGDATEACAIRYELPVFLGSSYPIGYTYESQSHQYFPDFAGYFTNDSLLIAEAGYKTRKVKGEELAKADAARHHARISGGEFWISTDETRLPTLFANLEFLNSRRLSFPSYADIREAFTTCWSYGHLRTPHDLISELASAWSAEEVEGAIWIAAADAVATGHLLFDLAHTPLSLNTPLSLLNPSLEPILLPPLPTSVVDDDVSGDDGDAAPVADTTFGLHGVPRIGVAPDSSALLPLLGQNPGSIAPEDFPSDEARQRFERVHGAVYDVVDGASIRSAAQKHGLHHSQLIRILERWRAVGDIALVAHGAHQKPAQLRPEYAAIIEQLYTSKQKLTMREIHEHPNLHREYVRLQKEDPTVRPATYRQVCLEVDRLKRKRSGNGRSPSDLREGDKHPAPERQSPYSYVLSLIHPAQEVQTDEHHCDLRIITRTNAEVTLRVYAGVLICVKTGAILSFVLSPFPLNENDYMRLIKLALEPKGRLTQLYACVNEWPCTAKPEAILHDRGPIFTSKHASNVIVDRLQVIQKRAPAWAPPVKGTVEALFQWVTHRLTHRLPGTTKSNPQARGAYDSDAEARKAGITFDVLEQYFTQAIVDDYMRAPDKLRGGKRFELWNQAVAEYGVPRYLGSRDDLKLLLMRSVNVKNSTSGDYKVHPVKGISFHGRWYVNPEVLPRLRGSFVTVYFDPRDISIIYIFLHGRYMGYVLCTTLRERTSIWEADAMRKAATQDGQEASEESTNARRNIVASATAGKAAQRALARELERKRTLDDRRPEVHPEAALAMAEAIERSRAEQGLNQSTPQARSTDTSLPTHSNRSSRSSAWQPPVPDDSLTPSEELPSWKRARPALSSPRFSPLSPVPLGPSTPNQDATDIEKGEPQ